MISMTHDVSEFVWSDYASAGVNLNCVLNERYVLVSFSDGIGEVTLKTDISFLYTLYTYKNGTNIKIEDIRVGDSFNVVLNEKVKYKITRVQYNVPIIEARDKSGSAFSVFAKALFASKDQYIVVPIIEGTCKYNYAFTTTENIFNVLYRRES